MKITMALVCSIALVQFVQHVFLPLTHAFTDEDTPVSAFTGPFKPAEYKQCQSFVRVTESNAFF